MVAEILGAGLDPEQPLMAAGLDSLGAVELRNSLEGRLGVQLPGTLVFDYPTTAALAGYLARRLAPQAAGSTSDSFSGQLDLFAGVPAGAAALMAPASLAASGGTAVVGMATRSPKGALRSSMAAVDGTAVVPLERWDLQEQAAVLGTAPVRFSIFLSGIDHFDAAAFGISDNEAVLMDPQQRLLLECTSEALLEAGAALGPGDRAGGGVFVGITSTEYSQLAQRHAPAFTPYSATGHLTASVAAGRLSYIFGMKGPSFPVDTVCSSSLVR